MSAKASVARRLVPVARPWLPALGAASGLGLLASALDLGLLEALRRLVDAAASPVGALPGRLLAGAFVVLVLREAADWGAAALQARASAGVVRDLQEGLFARLQRLPLGFFQRSPVGDLVARLFHDAPAAAALVAQAGPAFADAALRCGVMALAALRLDPLVGGALLLAVAPAVVFARLLARRLRLDYGDADARLAALYERAFESLGAAETVKTLGLEALETGAFREASAELARAQVRLSARQAAGGPLLRFVGGLALVALGGLGLERVAAGSLSAGSLAAALVAAWGFLLALQTTSGLHGAAQEGLAAADRVFALLDEPEDLAAPPPRPVASFERELRAEGVSFAYPGGVPVLHELELALRPDERVALVGRSGCGKTTLARLLLRLHDPVSGRLLLDGFDLRQLDPLELRRLLSGTAQEGAVFDRTLADNVRLARPEAGEAEVVRALEQAGLGPLLGSLPAGASTLVGSRGARLSGGERQRLALARLLLLRPRFALLDEATSALDAPSELEVRTALAAAGCRGLLVISHREAALAGTDRVLVLEDGRIAEAGPLAAVRETAAFRRALVSERLGP
ncbi:MAG: ABC transporter ATP-binding protein [Vicinamibacteria bacterium]